MIKEELQTAVPQLSHVVLVQAISDSLLEQARHLMGNTMDNGLVIGIRFCGGCNSRYGRVEVVRELGRRFPSA